MRKARRVGWELGKTHANGKLCRTETNIESAAGPIETEVDARRSLFILCRRAGTTPVRRDTLRDSTLALRTFSLGGERVSECSPTYETPKLATFPRTSDDGRPMEEIGKRGRRRIVVFFTRNENRTRLPRDRRADFPNYACCEGRQKNVPACLRFLESDSWKRTSRAFVRTTQTAIVQLSSAKLPILFGFFYYFCLFIIFRKDFFSFVLLPYCLLIL